MYSFRTVSVIPDLPEQICRLKELARNLWFSWHPQAELLFSSLDARLWEEVNHNPVKFLLYADTEKLQKAAANPAYLAIYSSVLADFDKYMQGETWYQKTYPEQTSQLVAYFSAEFGVHESNPVYSGGLGLLAGDHCKSASDLGLPFVGVGILYKQGYFCQRINREGRQEAHYCFMDFNEMTVTPAALPEGGEVIISVRLPGRDVYIKVWQLQVGRTVIYFLDSDLAQNSREDRLLTAKLYGGNQDTRICQEIILGIGGVKALRRLGIYPTAWHMNEGHAALTVLERLREYVQRGLSLAAAREVVRSNTVFTTHTPVPAGHDVFSADMVERYLGEFYGDLKTDRDGLLALGWDEGRQGFNMTKLALNHAAYTNGVSKLHGVVTKKMFSHLYPGIPLEEMPIHAITNGVHTETWVAPEIRKLFEKYIGPEWAGNISDPHRWQNVYSIPDQELWETHQVLKGRMIKFVQNNIYRRMDRNFQPLELIRECAGYLSKDVLTIGFARRFATYKRAYLLFTDKERLARLVNNPERPVQIIFAGKAHPADQPGQELIKMINEVSAEEPFKGKIVFVEDYDINVSRHLLQGVDVWLNTPRRPLEASGTSGMKAAVNGVINCSILDGWWPEAYNGENGFAVGTARDYENEEVQDREDARSLFDLLEQVIVPYYYRRVEGVPREWVRRMKDCLATIPWQFSTERMVKEYTQRFYLPAAGRGEAFSADSYRLAVRVQEMKKFLTENWHQISFRAVRVEQPPLLKENAEILILAEVFLGPIRPGDIVVEVVYGKVSDHGLAQVTLMPLIFKRQVAESVYEYETNIVLIRGTSGYTLRIRPKDDCFAHPFELPLVKWADNF
ncbi:alpha-glucan family phosphorylase [Desulforamulus hydrothermalis]|uniref:Maltodextrin phosphorylase n=1 Tax=Desulforamulus hydrothermalis Lam5 = DSM 18033 TaxID=1121428 RepID=K8DZ58_9FIRM|nr:alpha-glucan family phosphorylase [Desulforamulus hydrothermalis]CCO08190.1 Maltodextrin phosphorylase [Desulforamulus hydrothermalis Lam5 = DSM 18033]SHH22852.1 maltodextrin phosphorylase [Desulforamulus hydrothermalis Lam5 = DSM 18033]